MQYQLSTWCKFLKISFALILGLVPASVKRELLLRVKEHLLTTSGYYDDDPVQGDK